MPTTHPSSQPKQLTASDGNHAQKVSARRNATLAAAAQYKKYDIVTISATDGTISKFTSTTAADALRLASAHNDWGRNTLLTAPPASTLKWQKIDRLEGYWVMNLVGTTNADPSGQTRNVAYDTTDNVVKVQAGATSPAVKIISLAGEAQLGDTNVPVVVEFLSGVRH